tara:strand:- start:1025 stop:1795 length:771 start_codon:yes stop_codon:yes gene_type:complete
MTFLDNFLIFDTEYTKVRVGDKRDGGYVVLDEVSRYTEKLYSYGVETNTSFESDFCDRYGCNAVLFDHTVDGPEKEDERFTFVKEGLSHVKTHDCDTLHNHLQLYGNPERKTLKMDIEWCEWDVFEQMPPHVLQDFDQILCEFHVIPMNYKDAHTPYFTNFHKDVYSKVNDMLFDQYSWVLQALQEDYYIFHVHINNSLPCNYVGCEEIPPLIELSMVNQRLVDHPTLCCDRFPVKGLDYPNKTDRPDITHIRWNH